MDLYSSQPYWLMKNGLVNSYSSLSEDINVDVAIIGAGISGALCAYYLRNAGLKIAVLDRRHVGMGSTAASTAFLQYEIDKPLSELSGYVGFKKAVKAYELCREAVYDIGQICGRLKVSVDFHLRPSLHYASFNKHVDPLREEYKLRAANAFDVSWLESGDIKRLYGFDAPGAILSADAGEVDAYLLTHALFQSVLRKGHEIYSNTNVAEIVHHKRGVALHTSAGNKVHARKLIIACGYESLKYLPKPVGDVHATYALVSEPLAKEYLWHRNSLIWETADPYMYFRIVSGNRILIGGKDDKFHNPAIRDSRLKRKTKMLLHSFSRKMQHVPVRSDFSWCGAFVVTKDGLPYIGSIPERSHTYFALGYGGNGITFSVIAAQVISDLILTGKSAHDDLFSFGR